MRKALVEVRILPMNFQKEFKKSYKTLAGLQNYFFRKERFRNNRRKVDGEYWYRQSGLNARPGTMVLFQCVGSIVGRAKVIQEPVPFNPPRCGVYKGALFFKPETIKVFYPPVAAKIVRAVWPRFQRFNQTKQYLEPSTRYWKFEQRLKAKRVRII